MQRADGARAAAPEYDATAKTLHWLMALLVLAQFVVAWLMPGIGRNTPPSALINLHFSLGVTILALIAVRFAYRISHPVPLAMPGSPPWEPQLARASHIAFYVLLLVGPPLGWASASAHGLSVTVFGIFTLPDIAAPKARWALTAGDVHAYAMWCLLALIGLHVAAALWHRLVRHDGVLQRMLPRR
ncbi:MAG TPA: cytochrome b [Casimicrobiaceae bacterium]|nr:cytochrome b [Casimicrobiaceae bacterium]